MGKKKPKTNRHLPFVSICTPTFNRRPFIQTMLACFRNQTYPKEQMEWIIVDDGTDKIEDLIVQANIPQIQYFALDTKIPLGEKRNYMHKKAKGDIIVYMDDDDYYPPERVSHAVDMLLQNPTKDIAGSSRMFIYYKHDLHTMYQCGPYGENHATAGTFAFRKSLLMQTQYENHACLGEEKSFLKDFTIPMVQLDPLKTILVFSHEHNTFDKRKMLENKNPQYFRECNAQVRDFIRKKEEEDIYSFFMENIDTVLAEYLPGSPGNKPDVLKQIADMDHERETMPQIMINEHGKLPRRMNAEEIVETLQRQQLDLHKKTLRIEELESMLIKLQQQMAIIMMMNKRNPCSF